MTQITLPPQSIDQAAQATVEAVDALLAPKPPSPAQRLLQRTREKNKDVPAFEAFEVAGETWHARRLNWPEQWYVLAALPIKKGGALDISNVPALTEGAMRALFQGLRHSETPDERFFASLHEARLWVNEVANRDTVWPMFLKIAEYNDLIAKGIYEAVAPGDPASKPKRRRTAKKASATGQSGDNGSEQNPADGQPDHDN